MTPEEIVKKLRSMSKADAVDYVRKNWKSWPQDTYTALYQNATDAPDMGDVFDILAKAKDSVDANTDPNVLARKANQVVTDAIAGKKVNADLDGDGTVSPGEQAAIDQAASQTSKAVADQSGVPVTQVQSQVDKTLATSTGATKAPAWVLDLAASAGATTPDLDVNDEVKAKIVDNWNTVYGTHYNWDQLVALPQFQSQTGNTGQLVKNSLLGEDPQLTFNVTLPGNRTVQVTDQQGKSVFGAEGFNTKDLTKVIRYADTFGLKDAAGQTAWQPLAALMKAYGFTAGAGIDRESDPKYQQLKAKVDEAQAAVAKPAVTSSPQKVGGGLTAQVTLGDSAKAVAEARLEAAKKALSDYTSKKFPIDTGGAQKSAIGQLIPVLGKALSVSKLVDNYQKGLARYGDPSMAYLSSLDPDLAARLAMSGGDITKISQADMNKADQLMLKGGWDPQALASQGYAGGNGVSSFLSQLKAKADADKAAAIANMPPVRTYTDPTAIKQTAKDLWRALFLQDPSDSTVNAIANEIHSMEASAPIADQSTGTNGQSVDINSRIRQILEGSGEYKSLYGNKPGGLTESDYQSQFTNQSRQMLGNQADVASVRAGMMGNDLQTTSARTAVTGLGTSNSTLLGRLAQVAQTMAEMT